jgi:hypothetical protein
LDNKRHALTATIARKFTENVIGRLRYGWHQYRKTSNDGIDDYTSHRASVSCTFRF